jgi:hypothetical protein
LTNNYKPKVYTASTLAEHQLWRTFAEDPEWHFCHFTASWPYKAHLEWEAAEPPNSEVLREAWQTNVKEIKDSDFVLLYARLATVPKLRGALVECGVAIADGIRIVAVGLDPEHTWSAHHLVIHVPTLREARNYLLRYTVMIPPRTRKSLDAQSSDDND